MLVHARVCTSMRSRMTYRQTDVEETEQLRPPCDVCRLVAFHQAILRLWQCRCHPCQSSGPRHCPLRPHAPVNRWPSVPLRGSCRPLVVRFRARAARSTARDDRALRRPTRSVPSIDGGIHHKGQHQSLAVDTVSADSHHHGKPCPSRD